MAMHDFKAGDVIEHPPSEPPCDCYLVAVVREGPHGLEVMPMVKAVSPHHNDNGRRWPCSLGWLDKCWRKIGEVSHAQEG